MKHYYQGLFRPKHPQKYKGNPTNICYRSSWERRVMMELDMNPNVLQWASEEPWFSVPYLSPVDNKMHRYFPDFWVKTRNKDGNITISLIEVKPAKESKPPPLKTNGQRDKRYVRQAVTFAVNDAKWKAANALCESKGWGFKVLTEQQLKG